MIRLVNLKWAKSSATVAENRASPARSLNLMNCCRKAVQVKRPIRIRRRSQRTRWGRHTE